MRGTPVVILVTGSYPPAVCGVGDYTASLARALANTGRWKIKVVSAFRSTASAEDRAAGVEIIPLFRDWSLSRLLPTAQEIRKIDADLIHMQFPTQGYGKSVVPWLLPGLLRLAQKRVVQTWHEYIPSARSLPTLAAASAASEVVVVRPGYAERIPPPHRWAMRRARITHIPNASNIPITQLTPDERLMLRRSLVAPGRRLVGYFGFAYPHKRVDLLFDLVDPEKADLLVIGPLESNNSYHRRIDARMNEARWKGRVRATGFVDAARAADLLAACDVVALPFAEGGGEWNTSLHAVQSQGTFLVTTSVSRLGYVAEDNTFYCAPDDIAGLRAALAQTPPRVPPHQHGPTWSDVASAHETVYLRLIEDER